MVTIWVAIGAIFAAIAAWLGVLVVAQSGVFVLVSGILLIATRPLARKMLPKTVPLNSDRVIGEPGVVTEEIEPISGTGQIKVMGQIWSAKSADGSTIPVESTVEVVEIIGNRVVVEKISKEEIENA